MPAAILKPGDSELHGGVRGFRFAGFPPSREPRAAAGIGGGGAVGGCCAIPSLKEKKKKKKKKKGPRSMQGEKDAMGEVLQKKLQAELEKYQQMQKDLSKCMTARQKLEAQLTENHVVKEELDLLDSSNAVYKLIGPVLVKQDMEEAKATVGKRLDYITGEIKRYDTQIQDYERKSEQHREALGRLQQEFQRTQGKVSVKT